MRVLSFLAKWAASLVQWTRWFVCLSHPIGTVWSDRKTETTCSGKETAIQAMGKRENGAAWKRPPWEDASASGAVCDGRGPKWGLYSARLAQQDSGLERPFRVVPSSCRLPDSALRKTRSARYGAPVRLVVSAFLALIRRNPAPRKTRKARKTGHHGWGKAQTSAHRGWRVGCGPELRVEPGFPGASRPEL